LTTSYWSPAGAAILAGGLAVAVLARRASDQAAPERPAFRFYYVAFAAWGMAAGWAYLARSSGGYVTLLSALLVWGILLLQRRYYRRWLLALGLLVVGLALPVMAFRWTLNWRITHYNLSAPIPDTMTNHAFSHAVLVGWGYVTNDAGILWNDGVGVARAQQECPGVKYLGPEYYDCIRDQVIEIIRTNPDLIVRNLLAKTESLVQTTFTFMPLVFWLPLFLFWLRKPLYLGVFLVLLALNALPGLLTVPYVSYLQGYFEILVIFAAFGLIEFLARIGRFYAAELAAH
jgi:hypothetical protein